MFLAIIFIPKIILFSKQAQTIHPILSKVAYIGLGNLNDSIHTPIQLKQRTNLLKSKIKERKNIIFQNKDVIGILTIPKIGLEQYVKEGIDAKTLLSYIGHFPTTAKYVGNIGFAAHNRGYENNYFENVNKLKVGDEIIYKSRYGIKKYLVKMSKEISDEDWSYLQETKDNRVTLITCVKNKPNKRLCVQAIEVFN